MCKARIVYTVVQTALNPTNAYCLFKNKKHSKREREVAPERTEGTVASLFQFLSGALTTSGMMGGFVGTIYTLVFFLSFFVGGGVYILQFVQVSHV